MSNLVELPPAVAEFRKTVMAQLQAEETPLAQLKKMSELYKEEEQLWLSAYPERAKDIKALIKQSFPTLPV